MYLTYLYACSTYNCVHGLIICVNMSHLQAEFKQQYHNSFKMTKIFDSQLVEEHVAQDRLPTLVLQLWPREHPPGNASASGSRSRYVHLHDVNSNTKFRPATYFKFAFFSYRSSGDDTVSTAYGLIVELLYGRGEEELFCLRRCRLIN